MPVLLLTSIQLLYCLSATDVHALETQGHKLRTNNVTIQSQSLSLLIFSQVRFWNTQKSMCVGQFLAHEQGEYGNQSHIKISMSLVISLGLIDRIFLLTLQNILSDHINFQLRNPK